MVKFITLSYTLDIFDIFNNNRNNNYYSIIIMIAEMMPLIYVYSIYSQSGEWKRKSSVERQR